tara:strand:+ start:1019 stop:1294 length:276 start_codon:yes stop_codon:yes gene_type:complete
MTKEYELSEDMKKIIGKPQFRNTVMYAYNRSRHSFMFYVPMGDGGRELLPIGQYQPLISDELPYDPQFIVEDIADLLSRDIERQDREDAKK